MKISKIIEREGVGCFIVEDINGNWFRVQLAHRLEVIWQERRGRGKECPKRKETNEI